MFDSTQTFCCCQFSSVCSVLLFSLGSNTDFWLKLLLDIVQKQQYCVVTAGAALSHFWQQTPQKNILRWTKPISNCCYLLLFLALILENLGMNCVRWSACLQVNISKMRIILVYCLLCSCSTLHMGGGLAGGEGGVVLVLITSTWYSMCSSNPFQNCNSSCVSLKKGDFLFWCSFSEMYTVKN